MSRSGRPPDEHARDQPTRAPLRPAFGRCRDERRMRRLAVLPPVRQRIRVRIAARRPRRPLVDPAARDAVGGSWLRRRHDGAAQHVSDGFGRVRDHRGDGARRHRRPAPARRGRIAHRAPDRPLHERPGRARDGLPTAARVRRRGSRLRRGAGRHRRGLRHRTPHALDDASLDGGERCRDRPVHPRRGRVGGPRDAVGTERRLGAHDVLRVRDRGGTRDDDRSLAGVVRHPPDVSRALAGPRAPQRACAAGAHATSRPAPSWRRPRPRCPRSSAANATGTTATPGFATRASRMQALWVAACPDEAVNSSTS